MEEVKSLFQQVKPKQKTFIPHSKLKYINYKHQVKPQYLHIEHCLNEGIVGTQDPKDVAIWYYDTFVTLYKCEPVSFNLNNFCKVIQNIAEVFEVTIWEVCELLDEWFESYELLGYSKYCWDKYLTPSMLKKDWILQGLYNRRVVKPRK